MRCLRCGNECPEEAKFCTNCGKAFLVNIDKNEVSVDGEIKKEPAADVPLSNSESNNISTTLNNEKESIKTESPESVKKRGCLRLFIIILVAILAITGISLIKNSSKNEEKTNSSTVTGEPSEVELITYSEMALENYLSKPEFQFAEYYNVVETKGTLRAKVEGTVKDANKLKHEFTMILQFDDSNYETYRVAYLQLDGVDLISNNFGEGIEELQGKVNEAELNNSKDNEAKEFKLYELYDEVSYDELISNEKALVKISGTISQVLSKSDSIYEFCIITDDQIIYVDYIDIYKTTDIDEGKEVTIYGSYSGFEDHNTTDGNSISLPGIFASYVE